MNKIIILILFSLLLSCADKIVVIPNSGGDEELPFYRLEIEPSLSYDRSTLLMVRADTQLTQLNGIYSANVSNPVRVEEVLGESFSSPTIAVESKSIACMQNGNLVLYHMVTDLITPLISENFQEILFMSDSLLVLNIDSTISLYDIFTKELTTIATGYFPTSYNIDTLAYLKKINSDTYEINLLPIAQFSNFAVSVIAPIDTIFASAIKSFGIEPQFQRFCYSEQNGDRYDVFIGAVGVDTVRQVVPSDYSDVVMLDLHTVLYTGIDGRLYRVNFEGTESYPYWASENF